MHKEINITLYLAEKYNDQNLLKILDKLNHVIKIYDYVSGERYFNSKALTINGALTKIKLKNEDSPTLCRMEDGSSFFLYFDKEKNDFLSLTLWYAFFPWKKEFRNGVQAVEFDMQRYLRLMLLLTQGLKIKKIEAKIEWD